jgi:hypothetical protein
VAARLALLAALTACAGSGVGCGGSKTPDAGDGLPLAVDPAMYALDMTLVDLHDGDTIDLLYPPQGGFVLFAGAKVRHLAESVVELRGRLLGLDGTPHGEDVRTVAMITSLSDPTIATPDLKSYLSVANIPVCPSTSTTDLYDKMYLLEVQVTELQSKRVGVGRRMVTASCRQSDATQLALCRCECGANFMIGKCH